MSENLYGYQQMVNLIETIVENKLNEYSLLVSEWRVGKVDSVTSSTKLMVFLDGSTVSQPISCNPDVTFVSGNEVYVITPLSSKSKFVLCKRGV